MDELIASQPGPAAANRFAKLIDASPVPFALNDEAGNITLLNPAFVRTFGYDLADIPTVAAWWPKAYPDLEYRAWVERTWAQRLAVSKEAGTPFEPLEVEICCKDGSVRSVLASAASLEGSFRGDHLVVLFDITERTKTASRLAEQERQLEEIFDHLPAMVFVKDSKDLRFVRFNRAGERLLGRSREELIGKADADFFPPEQAAFFTARDRAVLASGKLEDIADELIDTPNGKRSLHTRKVAIHDAEGNPKYLLGISEDITETKRIAAENARLQRERQQAQKMASLGLLAGGIAHDFNNVLGVISGYAAQVEQKAHALGDLGLLEDAKTIVAASQRATKVVAQMLAFSRSNVTEYVPVDLARLLRDDANLLRATLPSSIELAVDVEEGLPPSLMNPTQIHQVLMNLAINARDAMNGSGTLSISLRWARDLDTECSASHRPVRGDWLELRVADTGTGIPEPFIDHIFTPFFTTKAVGKGTGMGLAMVYGFINAHGGHIVVETRQGHGTSFRVFFKPTTAEAAARRIDDAPRAQPITNAHLLVVDDEPALGRIVGRWVRAAGYDVTVFLDSTEALAAFRASPQSWSMLVTDQTMPGMTGFELVEAMRALRPGLPVIVLSGNFSGTGDDSPSDVCCLPKPIDEATMTAKISELLRARQA